MFLFSDGLSLMISRLSLISNKYFLFAWAKTLKFPKVGKKLQWSKWWQIALLFDSLTFFPVRGDTPVCFPDLISQCLILSPYFHLFLTLKLYANKVNLRNLQPQFIENLLLVAYIVILKIFYLWFTNLAWYIL